MLKNVGKVALILLIYLSTLIFFELVFGAMKLGENQFYMEEHGFANPLLLLTPFIMAGFYHFIFVSLLAICTIFIKKVPHIVKNTIYIFPLLTIFLAYPMMIPTSMLANLLNIPMLNP